MEFRGINSSQFLDHGTYFASFLKGHAIYTDQASLQSATAYFLSARYL